MAEHQHIWVDHFWTADDYPKHPAALQGFVYWQTCRDCETFRNPEPIILGESGEPLVTPGIEPMTCYLCSQVAVTGQVVVNGYAWSRYPLCADCLKPVVRNALRGKRTRVG